MKPKLIVLILVMLALMPQVLAIGVAPASHDVLMTTNTYSYDIHVINDVQEEGLFEIELTGGLSDYIILDKKQFEFTKDKDKEVIKVILTIPDGEDLGDIEFTNRIIIKKVGKETSTVVARVGVAAKLVVTLPHKGAFVTAKLFAPPFVNEVPNSFTIEGTNKGDKEATDCVAKIDILTREGKIVENLELEPKNIPALNMESFVLEWTPIVRDGEYRALASLVCSGFERFMEKKFMVLSPNVQIDSFTAEKFSLGEISKFNLVISTIWPSINDVFANIELLKGDEMIEDTTTESTDLIANTPVTLPVFLDTANIEPGKYTIIVTLHYLEKELSEVFSAQISATDILLNSLSGKVISEDNAQEPSSIMSFLIIIIAIVVLINGILAYKLIKKKNDRKD